MLAGAVAVVGLTVLAAPPADAADPCGPTGNKIACENSKPGTPQSEWDITGAGDDDIQGFATDISVNVGSRVDFKIDTSATAYTIDIYRTGWYGGDGARLIASVTPSASLPQRQPACITDASTELYDCGNWGVSASWNVPVTAVSGVYVAKLTRTDNRDSSHITFVVRDDSSTSDLLFQTSDSTWHAYNAYGGSNFYWGGANGRSFKVSYNRPFATRGGTEARDFYMSSEYAMVRFLERNGYDMSYTTDVDSDRRGQLIKNHKVFLSVGHDEYWSGAQRTNIESARDAGVNMVFATGNEAYWRTRFEKSTDSSQTDYRTLVCYKETWGNGRLDPMQSQWTGTWRDPRFASPATGAGKPENSVSGTAYMSNNTDLPVTVSAAEGKLRLWRNTSLASLAAGTTQALAPHTVGYESNEDLDNGFRPSGLIRLSTTTGAVPQYLLDFGTTVAAGTTTHHTTLYRAASGALVFSSGSIQWSWGLDQTHDGDGAPADSRMQQAQVNLLADMGAQPTTLMSTLTAAAKSTDTTGPTTTITSTGTGPVVNGTRVTASGTASDAAGRVAGVEVSTDGGVTWKPASGTTSWTYSYVQHGVGSTALKVRAIDDSANTGPVATQTRTVTCPCSVYGTEVPAVPDSQDGGPVELGLRFAPSSDGFVSGVRFYKSAANSGAHTGTLWTSAGARLATVNFSGETASGWQSMDFSAPAPVVAGETYVVSYTAPNGHYAAENGKFWYRGIEAAPLEVAGGYDAQPAGVYATAGNFPSQSYNRGHYYVDVKFTSTDESPLSVTNRWPLPDSSSVAPNTTVTAKFNKPIQQETLSVVVKDQLNNAVSGSTGYDAASRTVTFTPSQPLSGFVTYTVTLAAKDALGQSISSNSSWSFRTAKPDPAPGVCPCSLFPESTTPAVLQVDDLAPVTLGVRFTAKVNGTVSGVAFYKGPNNSGPHIGSLWRADGTLLAQGTFSAESSSGWQTLEFATPVAVTKDTEYVAAYRAPRGAYSATLSGLAGAVDRDPLVSVANGGSYSYPDGFPGQRSGTNYLVDVVFDRTAPAIAVAGQSPAPNAVGVARNKAIQVWFTEPIQDGSVLSVSTGGQSVAGTTSLSGDRKTLTFTPSAALPASADVQVSLTGVKSVDGAILPAQAWSFTTGSSAPPETMFGAQVPTVMSNDDGAPVELGTVFSPTRDGKVTAIRFFKGAGNAGTHTGSLWNESGTRLATVTFTDETPGGWQTADLATPVPLKAGASYVVSYYAPQGHYSSTPGFFSAPWANGPLTAPAGNNGRYLYGGGGGLPAYSYNATNYFVDVLFVSDAADISVVSTSPQDGAQNVATQSDVSVQLSAAIADGYSFTLTSGGSAVPGSSSLSTDRKTLTFTPSGSLPGDATVSVSLTGVVSQLGAALGPKSWSFTTSAPTTTLFGNEQPNAASINESDALELGTAFTPSTAGSVTGVRFYKGPGNTGTHTGSLWSEDGQRLATVTFDAESSAGWQSAAFTTPVPVSAGSTYVVSYYAPNGHFSASSGYFTQPKTSGPLTAPAGNNGRYRYGAGGGFPTGSWASTNYFVDVMFRTAG